MFNMEQSLAIFRLKAIVGLANLRRTWCRYWGPRYLHHLSVAFRREILAFVRFPLVLTVGEVEGGHTSPCHQEEVRFA
jgi:hypothetical protein